MEVSGIERGVGLYIRSVWSSDGSVKLSLNYLDGVVTITKQAQTKGLLERHTNLWKLSGITCMDFTRSDILK